MSQTDHMHTQMKQKQCFTLPGASFRKDHASVPGVRYVIPRWFLALRDLIRGDNSHSTLLRKQRLKMLVTGLVLFCFQSFCQAFFATLSRLSVRVDRTTIFPISVKERMPPRYYYTENVLEHAGFIKYKYSVSFILGLINQGIFLKIMINQSTGCLGFYPAWNLCRTQKISWYFHSVPQAFDNISEILMVSK